MHSANDTNPVTITLPSARDLDKNAVLQLVQPRGAPRRQSATRDLGKSAGWLPPAPTYKARLRSAMSSPPMMAALEGNEIAFIRILLKGHVFFSYDGGERHLSA